MTYVDGNAAIGMLSLAIGADVGPAAMVCGACGHDHPVAESRVYLRCPGTVIRCPSCDSAEIVMVEIDHHIHLTIHNVATLRLSSVPDR